MPDLTIPALTLPALTIPDLTAFDCCLIAIVLLSTVMALMRGMVRVLFSIAGMIAGLLVASWYTIPVAQRLTEWIHPFEAAEVLAFMLLLICVATGFALMAAVVRRTIAAVGLGSLDRLLGAVFGLLRGVLVAVVLMAAIAAFAPDSRVAKNSQLAPYFLAAAHALSFVVPDHFQKQVADGATRLLQRVPESVKSNTVEWKHPR